MPPEEAEQYATGETVRVLASAIRARLACVEVSSRHPGDYARCLGHAREFSRLVEDLVAHVEWAYDRAYQLKKDEAPF